MAHNRNENGRYGCERYGSEYLLIRAMWLEHPLCLHQSFYAVSKSNVNWIIDKKELDKYLKLKDKKVRYGSEAYG